MSTQRVCPECGTQTDDLTCPKDGEMTLVVRDKDDAVTSRIGTVVCGRYRVIQVVGQGGFGAVYKAQHIATGDALAIKVLRGDVQASLEVASRFRQEAKATSRLKHPNTVRVFDFGQMEDGNLFLAMEFLDGRTLSHVMRAEGPLAARRLVHVALQVLKSLSEAHSKGIVHRDLKPDNIFLQQVHGEADFVRVLDFGIAKSLSGDSTADMTSTGAIIGTPRYMSPEQARGAKVDARTDLYALGIILFEGLTGTAPFTAESPLSMLLRRVQEQPPRVHDQLVRPAPVGLCDAVLRALSREVEGRFASADEMAAALTAGLETADLPACAPLGMTRNQHQEMSGETLNATSTGHSAQARVVVDLAAGDDASCATMDVGRAPELLAAAPRTVRPPVSPLQPTEIKAVQPEPVVTMPAALPAAAAPARAAPELAEPPTRLDMAPALPAAAVASAPAATRPRAGWNPWIVIAIAGFAAVVAAVAVVAGRAPVAPAQAVMAAQVAAVAPAAAPPAVAAAAPAPVAAVPPAPPAAAAAVAAPAAALVALPAPALDAAFLVECQPADALVEIDGKPAMPGHEFRIAPGRHQIAVSKPGYATQTSEMAIQPGEVRKLAFSLDKIRRAGEKRSGSAGSPGGKPAVDEKPPGGGGLLIQ